MVKDGVGRKEEKLDQALRNSLVSTGPPTCWTVQTKYLLLGKGLNCHKKQRKTLKLAKSAGGPPNSPRKAAVKDLEAGNKWNRNNPGGRT